MGERSPYGPKILNGVIQYESPSGLERARSCLRDWGFRYVAKRKKPQSKGQIIGTEGHSQIERYLKTGEPVLGQHALKGRQFIPDPHPDLFIEQEIKDLGLDADGIPVVGKIDVLNMTGKYVAPMGSEVRDFVFRPEVIDWKFLSDLKYAKSGQALLDTIQMNAYGLAVQRARKDSKDVRLSQVHFCTRRKQAEKSTIVTSRQAMEDFWGENVVPVARLIQAAAAESDPNQLPANTKACDSFGGCFHKPVCTAWKESSLESMFGQTMTKQMEERMTSPVDNMIANLKQQEVAAGVPQNGAKAVPGVPPGFADAIESIELSGFGMPGFGGEAAKAYSYLKGLRYSLGMGYAGHGKLGESGNSLHEVADVITLASQLAGHTATAQPAQPEEIAVALPAPLDPRAAPVPPDAPASNPAIAADPVENPPPGVDQSHLKVETKPADREKELKKLKKGELLQMVLDLESRTESNTATVVGPVVVEKTEIPSLRIFVNVQVNEESQDLRPYVEQCVNALAESEGGVDDIRCAPEGSPLAYAKWKGALASLVKRNPPPDGTYVLLMDQWDEFGSIVVAALRDKVVGYGVR